MARFIAVLLAVVAAAKAQDAISEPVFVGVPEFGSATFQSKNYPELYPANHYESWTVATVVGTSIQFDSVAFSLEGNCNYDYVEILENGVSLGRFCGDSGPNGFRTVGNQATVVFKTDSSVERNGFVISVSVAKCPRGVGFCPNNPDVCLPRDAWCNGVEDCPDGIDEQCPEPGVCGVASVQPTLAWKGSKIVGGIDATPNSWPWQIGFMSSGNFLSCGGSVIGDRYIMTAAHCCSGKRPTGIKIKLGAHKLDDPADTGYDVDVEKIIMHPEYTTRPATDQDFCLLKTKEPIVFGRTVVPVCLPSPSDSDIEAPGTECYITGWGTTRSGGSTPKILQQTRVKISNQTLCDVAYNGVITDTMICAAEPGRDTCQGDSGGPLVCKDAEGRFKLVGVTSWGRGCALPTHPGIYARTSTALSWIAEAMVSN